MLRTVLTVVHAFISVGIIGLVLLQRGKGADAGAGFGAGASGTVFGARGARTALSRATAVLAGLFMVNSLVLAYMGTRTAVKEPATILDQPVQSTPTPAGSTPPAITGPSSPVTPAPTPEPAQPPR